MKTVAVIFGGRSTEHDVSVVTALASVIKPLELTKRYHVKAVYIAKDGSWYCSERLKDIKLYQSAAIDEFLAREPKVKLDINEGLKIIQQGKLSAKATSVDIVFPAMHGTHGEDGELMGLLELANVPYVGCGVTASAVAMDKSLSKLVASGAGIPTPKWLDFEADKISATDVKKISKELKYPLFVKPAHLGSSIGITRVAKEAELANALEVAAHYDNRVLVEEAVQNLVEVTLPITGNEEPEPAYLEQPLTKPEDFFDFGTKYLQGGKKGKGAQGAQGYSKIPADLPKDLYEKAEEVGLGVYTALGCSGIARVDMLIDAKAKQVYFNEVNPLPGGLYAHNWAKRGVSNVELVQKLVDLAEERFAARQKKETVFSTNYLKQF